MLERQSQPTELIVIAVALLAYGWSIQAYGEAGLTKNVQNSNKTTADSNSPWFCYQQIASMGNNIDLSPIVWWDQVLRIVDDSGNIWFEEIGNCDLLHWQPGYVIDQLLLGLVICLVASSGIHHHIGLFQLLLYLLLSRNICARVLTVILIIIRGILVELECEPILRIGIVSDPIH